MMQWPRTKAATIQSDGCTHPRAGPIHTQQLHPGTPQSTPIHTPDWPVNLAECTPSLARIGEAAGTYREAVVSTSRPGANKIAKARRSSRGQRLPKPLPRRRVKISMCTGPTSHGWPAKTRHSRKWEQPGPRPVAPIQKIRRRVWTEPTTATSQWPTPTPPP